MPKIIPCEHAPKGCSECRYQRKLLKAREYKAARPEIMQAANREYHADHREDRRADMRTRYDQNAPEERARSKSYRDERPEQYMRYKGVIFPPGMTKAQWWAAQQPFCAGCGRPPTAKNPLVIDHDHSQKTNPNIRGPLHRNCNSGIGKLGDTWADAQKLADYLREYEQPFDTVWDFP